ncbi:MAG: MIP/aquaporin family protein [Thermoleophilaceae bacterium]
MVAITRVMSPRARWRETTVGEYGSEFLGTFVLIMFGDGVVAMTVAALNQSGRGEQLFAAAGDWMLIATGWGLAVTLAVYVAGGISSAHINPAVTLAMAVFRDFPWRKVPGYMVAQVLGAFVAGALVYLNYKQAINSFEAANDITRGELNSIPSFSIFATFPAEYYSNAAGPFLDEVIGTALLVGIVLAVVDEFNLAPKANMGPLIIGFIVFAIGMSFGANSGYAINPARDLGPRLFAWIQGWGDIAVPGNYGNVDGYMWVPIVAPLVGGLIGALVYDFFVHNVLRARGPEPPPPGRAADEEHPVERPGEGYAGASSEE